MGHYAEGDTHGYTREDASLEEQEYERQAEAEEMLLQITDVLKSHNRHHLKAPDHEQAVEAIRAIVTPRGKWINRCCSECGTFTSLNIFNVKYCPECGARME